MEESEPDRTILNHELDHNTIVQPDVALEQPLSWVSLALPEAASFDALHGNFVCCLYLVEFCACLFYLVLR